jgi:iron complex outermembrane recepter protein
MKRITFIVLLFVVCLGASAQSIIKGKIIDQQTKESLIGAAVMVDGTSKGTAAQLDGSFTLKIANGDYKLSISFIGYKEKKVDVSVKGDMDLGVIELESSAIGLNELVIMASFARDRQTPVSVSRIEPTKIEDKLGSKEFPEILKSTPSVYATKTGGGFGDGRINLRGFESNNIGVLINGVPINGMEDGKVYWSNWSGLSDVTSIMQLQRGLGASKLAISSVGGTINILTKTTDMEAGGNVFYGIGNDNYKKIGFTLSTGLLDNGWALTIAGSRTTSDGYIQATNFEAWSYFFNVSKRINTKHTIAFTGFGAPQWHNQRSNKHYIQDYRDNAAGNKFNSDFGYDNGKILTTGYAYNYYHKPQFSLNHSWQINSVTSLQTSVYASLASGGGRRAYGTSKNWISINNSTGYPYTNSPADTKLTPEGYIDWAAVKAANAASLTGSQAILANGTNSHDWYGLLSTFTTEIGKLSITGGIDARYYVGYHNYEISDLLGGSYYVETKDANINRAAGTVLKIGDKVSYDNTGIIAWGGVFGQAEYKSGDFSAFASVSGASTNYQRIDYFQKTPGNQYSEWIRFFNYSVKGGVNYNLTANHNIFVNGGYFTRAPYFNVAFKNNTNAINDGVKPEKAISAEVGYGFRSKQITVDITGYYTSWMDKSLTRSYGSTGGMANILGLDAVHTGVEVSAKYTPYKKLDISLMTSIGNWKWKNDVIADIYDENQKYQSTVNVYAKDLHVGDAAQTTVSAAVDFEVLPKVKVGLDFNYFDNLYSYFKIENRDKASDRADAWKLPAYNLLDLNIKYSFKMGKHNASLIGNVDNLFDTEYIADANDGISHTASDALVYYGFGRTWNLSLKVRF